MNYVIDTFDTGDGHFTIQPVADGKRVRLDFTPSLDQHIALGEYSTREAARDAIVARTTRYDAWDTADGNVADERVYSQSFWVRHQSVGYDPSVTQLRDIPTSEFWQPSPLAPQHIPRPSA